MKPVRLDRLGTHAVHLTNERRERGDSHLGRQHSRAQPHLRYRAQARRPSPGNLADGPILVVDDDPSILATVEDILDFEGYEVVTAMNGQEALRILEKRLPSLVVLDMRMPVVDGWGFAERVRERGIEVPLLVMTAARNAQRWAEEIGAAGYVAKPFEMSELLQEIERVRGEQT